MNYRIKDGLIIDPAQKINAIKQDLLVKDGLIVEKFDSVDKFENQPMMCCHFEYISWHTLKVEKE